MNYLLMNFRMPPRGYLVMMLYWLLPAPALIYYAPGPRYLVAHGVIYLLGMIAFFWAATKQFGLFTFQKSIQTLDENSSKRQELVADFVSSRKRLKGIYLRLGALLWVCIFINGYCLGRVILSSSRFQDPYCFSVLLQTLQVGGTLIGLWSSSISNVDVAFITAKPLSPSEMAAASDTHRVHQKKTYIVVAIVAAIWIASQIKDFLVR